MQYEYVVRWLGCAQGFFRRTMKEQGGGGGGWRYECARGGRCEVRASTRNACKRCRYEKCVLVGMRAEGSRIGRQPNAIKHATLLEALTLTHTSLQHQHQHLHALANCDDSADNSALVLQHTQMRTPTTPNARDPQATRELEMDMDMKSAAGDVGARANKTRTRSRTARSALRDPLDLVHWPGSTCSSPFAGAGDSPAAPGAEADLQPLQSQSQSHGLPPTGPDAPLALPQARLALLPPLPSALPLPVFGTDVQERRGRRPRPAASTDALGGARRKKPSADDAQLLACPPAPHTAAHYASALVAPSKLIELGSNRRGGAACGSVRFGSEAAAFEIDAESVSKPRLHLLSTGATNGVLEGDWDLNGYSSSGARPTPVEHPLASFAAREDLDLEIDKLADAFQKMGNFFTRVRWCPSLSTLENVLLVHVLVSVSSA